MTEDDYRRVITIFGGAGHFISEKIITGCYRIDYAAWSVYSMNLLSWLRINHNISIEITPSIKKGYDAFIHGMWGSIGHKTYQDAVDSAILYVSGLINKLTYYKNIVEKAKIETDNILDFSTLFEPEENLTHTR